MSVIRYTLAPFRRVILGSFHSQLLSFALLLGLGTRNELSSRFPSNWRTSGSFRLCKQFADDLEKFLYTISGRQTVLSGWATWSTPPCTSFCESWFQDAMNLLHYLTFFSRSQQRDFSVSLFWCRYTVWYYTINFMMPDPDLCLQTWTDVHHRP